MNSLSQVSNLENNLSVLENVGLITNINRVSPTIAINSTNTITNNSNNMANNKPSFLNRFSLQFKFPNCKPNKFNKSNKSKPVYPEFEDWETFVVFITSIAQSNFDRTSKLLKEDKTKKWFGRPLNPDSNLEPDLNAIHYLSRILFDIYGKKPNLEFLNSFPWEDGWYIGESIIINKIEKPHGFGSLFRTDNDGFLINYHAGNWIIVNGSSELEGWYLEINGNFKAIKEKGHFNKHLNLHGLNCFRLSSLGQGFTGRFNNGKAVEGMGDLDAVCSDNRFQGMVFRGNFKKGGLSGQGTVFYGSTQFSGNCFVPNEPYTGQGVFIGPNGETFCCYYKNGISLGDFTLELPDESWSGTSFRGFLSNVKKVEKNSKTPNPKSANSKFNDGGQVFEIDGLRKYGNGQLITPDGYLHFQADHREPNSQNGYYLTEKTVFALDYGFQEKSCSYKFIYHIAICDTLQVVDIGNEDENKKGKGIKKKLL